MSVLIRGIEMPTSCCTCPCFNAISGYYCQATHDCLAKEDVINSRQTNCPLVEVPPHGDLIDRDAIIESFNTDIRVFTDALNQNRMSEEYTNLHSKAIKDRKEIISYLFWRPTIIEAEDGET